MIKQRLRMIVGSLLAVSEILIKCFAVLCFIGIVGLAVMDFYHVNTGIDGERVEGTMLEIDEDEFVNESMYYYRLEEADIEYVEGEFVMYDELDSDERRVIDDALAASDDVVEVESESELPRSDKHIVITSDGVAYEFYGGQNGDESETQYGGLAGKFLFTGIVSWVFAFIIGFVRDSDMSL